MPEQNYVVNGTLKTVELKPGTKYIVEISNDNGSGGSLVFTTQGTTGSGVAQDAQTTTIFVYGTFDVGVLHSDFSLTPLNEDREIITAKAYWSEPPVGVDGTNFPSIVLDDGTNQLQIDLDDGTETESVDVLQQLGSPVTISLSLTGSPTYNGGDLRIDLGHKKVIP